MQHDVRQQYQQAIDESHHGQPTVLQTIPTGGRGRPSIRIDPDFLRWAYSLRSTSGIARFLGVSRRLVRDQLLEHGIAQPQEQPFMLTAEYHDNSDENSDFLDPTGVVRDSGGNPVLNDGDAESVHITSYTGPLSTMSDDELDSLIIRLRHHFRRAGVTMLHGMLQRLGHRVPRERIRQSLVRIDPVQRVFQRIRIRRRVYRVPGPNSLWHHDGQHGMYFLIHTYY